MPVTHPEQKTQPEEEETDNTALLLTGTSKSGVQYKGHVEIPNLSDENSVDEVEVCAFQFLICLSFLHPLILR